MFSGARSDAFAGDPTIGKDTIPVDIPIDSIITIPTHIPNFVATFLFRESEDVGWLDIDSMHTLCMSRLFA